MEFRRNEQQLELVRKEIDALKMRVEQARQRVENIEKDPVEMEATIRRIRRLTRDGEIIFRIEEQPIRGDTAVAPPFSSSSAENGNGIPAAE
ncbi:MAG TPA: hypothetical protein ENN29_08785 [Candidatus Hydrogenedentes bacterium]|nr:hypothetical protein [Candidatus Hydrogenedentota bacterium]